MSDTETRAVGRPRKHKDAAEKQAAYRERKAEAVRLVQEETSVVLDAVSEVIRSKRKQGPRAYYDFVKAFQTFLTEQDLQVNGYREMQLFRVVNRLQDAAWASEGEGS